MPLTTYTAGQVLTAASLNSNFSFAAKVAQVVNATYSTDTSTTSTTFVTTGLSASITPTSNTSKILVMANTFGQQISAAALVYFTLFRGTVAGTNLATGATPFMSGGYSGGGDLYFTVACQFLDSPATTSATTYTLGFRAGAATSCHTQKNGATATMTLMEILA